MNIFQIIVGLAFVSDVFLGLVVLKTNPDRALNRAYALLCVALGAWLLSVGFVLITTVASHAEMGIRLASMAAFFFFNMCHLLRICICNKDQGLWRSLLETKGHILAGFVFGALVLTDFYMDGVTLSQGAGVAEPHYGPGFLLMNAYFLTEMLSLVIGLVVDIRRSVGMQRLELQYVAIGAVLAGGHGGVVALVVPLVTHSSQTAPLAPLGVIIFCGVVAYGIARRRIMDVSHVVQRSAVGAIMILFASAVYFGAWAILNWVLTISCGVPAAIPYLAASGISMWALSAVRPSLNGWVRQVLFEKGGGNVIEMLDDISRDLQNVTTKDKLLERFMALAPRAVGASNAAMFITEGTQYRYPADSFDTGMIDLSGPISRFIQKERIPLILENVERQQQTSDRAAFCARLHELAGHAAIGVFSPRKLEGILVLGPRTGGNVFSYIELDALQLLCNQLAVSLENASLYTEVQNARIYNEILLDQLVSGVLAADAGGLVTFFNREARRITGLPDLKGTPISRVPEILQGYWRNAVESGQEIRDCDLKMELAPDITVPVRLSAAPFRSATGDILGALLVFNDMTDMKALESTIRRADRLMSVGTLAAGMAHEIKNPLVSIKTFSQLLPERYDDPDFRQTFSALVGQEVSRIDGIVNQLLRFARPEHPRLLPLRLHEVLDRSVSLVQEQLKSRGLNWSLQLDASHGLIQGDSDLLHQVLVNFYLNAIDAMQEGGVLTIKTCNVGLSMIKDALSKNELWIKVDICDTGKGIPQDELPKIFDPFYTSKSEGTGLGLSVAYNIVKEHGGSIDVASDLEHGTHFSVFFPISDSGGAS